MRLGLVELSNTGRREATRRLLVTASLARRRHGITRSHTTTARYVRQLHHTLGANAVFVELAAAAMRLTSRGGDEVLLEWRSAAASARGRFRPDGYGCYRRGTWRFGFFVEYDRGTEKPAQHAAKLATYYRYRNSGAYKRDYHSFPTLLVVTTTKLAEERFAQQAYLAVQRYGGEPLRLFLTTTGRIRAHDDGILGAIWRAPGPDWTAGCTPRACWLPSLRRDTRDSNRSAPPADSGSM